ncbi:MAG: hypothetical protein KC468_25565, partial [Myxococcales bacterium]|nr:hypothetical protein [Myxococcales bacterium]
MKNSETQDETRANVTARTRDVEAEAGAGTMAAGNETGGETGVDETMGEGGEETLEALARRRRAAEDAGRTLEALELA